MIYYYFVIFEMNYLYLMVLELIIYYFNIYGLNYLVLMLIKYIDIRSDNFKMIIFTAENMNFVFVYFEISVYFF